MRKPRQKRTLETRARLIAAAEAVVEQSGYEALRVEEVVLRAGVAKGTFFAHFGDKDELMDLMIGARIDEHLDRIEARPAPSSVSEMTEALMPMLRFMTCERYVFDVILRHSGAAALDQIGAIAMTFERQARVVGNWLKGGPFRTDIGEELMAEGVQAFILQALALHFCALHSSEPIDSRLTRYLEAWLLPAG